MPREGKRRIRAALALKDWTFDNLAEAVNRRGYGERNLRDLGVETDPTDEEIAMLAKAFELPRGFFTASLQRIYEDEPTQLERIESGLTAALRVLREQTVDQDLLKAVDQAIAHVVRPAPSPESQRKGA